MENIKIVECENINKSYDGVLYIKNLTEKEESKCIEYRQEIETDLYKGYIYVSVGYYHPHKQFYLSDAYLDLKGKKVWLMEQKHYQRDYSIRFNDVKDAIPICLDAIKWLNDYLKSDWLNNKPMLKKDILSNSKYKSRVFEYKGVKYLCNCDSRAMSYNLVEGYTIPQGNEVYRIEV